MRDLSGQTFGSYRLEGLLGRGGMGEVYRARHLRLLNRLAAVKILPTTLANEPDFLQRFEHEANSAASLDHPAILPVWDYGEQEGQPYLAMPLVTGGSLKELLERQGPLSPAEAERYLAPIAEALDYAHSRGILHRDVKPANILLRDDGRPQLADFGIAKAIETTQTPGLTQAGSGIGTPEYMAPEQIEGRAEKKSDLYSLGMALYQMLSGRVPYDGKTPYEIAIKQLSTPLPSIRQFRPDLSLAIEQVLNKALAKDPHLRYESGRAFADAFHEASTGTVGEGATVVQGTPDVYQQQTTPLQVAQDTMPLPVGPTPPTPTVIAAPPPSVAFTPPVQEYAPPPVMPPPIMPPPGPAPRPRANTSWPLTVAALIVAFLIVGIGSLGAYAAFFRMPTSTATISTATIAVATNTVPATAGPLIGATQTAAASANATATALAAPPPSPTIAPIATANLAATGTAAAQQAATATAIVNATARASAAAATANTAATAGANATATANGVAAQTATAAARPTGTPTRAPTATATAPPPTNTPVPPTLTPTRAPSAPPSAAPSAPPSVAPSAAPTATKPPTSGWGPTLPPLTGGKTYDDPQGRFSFSMPTDWSKNNAGTVDATVGPADDSANFTVNLDRLTGNTTLDAYNQTIERQLRLQFANYTVVSLDKVMVGDHQAYRRVSRGAYLGQNLEFVLVYFINKNTAHLLTGVCVPADFDRLAPTFDGMAGSYKVGE